MLKNRTTKLMCLLIAFVWTTILIGSSYAYFIDSVEVTGNVIAAGNLKAGLEYMDKSDGQWKDASRATIFNYQRWEPGYTDVQYICMSNKGDLALQYELNLVPDVQTTLMDVIDVYFGEVEAGYSIKDRTTFWEQVEADNLEYVGTMRDLLNNSSNPHGLYGADTGVLLKGESKTACIVLHMQEEAGNEYQNLSVGEGFKLQMYATQYMYETDSFGKDYDEGAKSELPELKIPTSMTIQVQPVNGLVPSAVVFDDPVNGVSATVPAGAKMVDGATSLTLIVSPMDNSKADIDEGENEVRISYNVKVEGLATDNTVPAVINMGEVLPKGLNLGNYSLYHVENGNTVKMTLVSSTYELDAHNEFTYDPATGEVSVAMATFSEVAMVADTEAKWEGNFDYSWYTNAVTLAEDESVTEFIIANADQLAAFGAIVGGMAKNEDGNKIAADDFEDKNVKLISDINLGDAEDANDANKIFYPIGYYNSTGSYDKSSGGSVTSSVSSFEGTFDGNGHTIANFYQNTWEMFGDYNDGYTGTPNHYKDAMGLFGYVVNGTVKNLTVENFKSDGEFTPTGVIAAYAVNSTFENIAITNCNPRVYNTGNGGIIGIAGNSNDQGTQITLRNITVDNSNKITALWGSWDVACGGLVGMFRGNADGGTGEIHFENCHVSAQIDVYNDVCANYQYYAYRYAGMIIGSVRHNTTNADGKTIPNMTGISASGCTVNYGDWNDYYYCEFVDNTIASYTHDYQFSRVDKSEITFDKNGNVTGCTHDHTKGGYETTDIDGDGIIDSSVLKEDKTAIYLPFHQLFTGYSWGVSSIGLEKYSGIVTNLGITEGDQEESVVKFNSIITEGTSYTSGYTVKIDDLFQAVANPAVPINNRAVYVAVSPLNESTANGIYKSDTDKWENGTLTFTGAGPAKITITDYYFCKTTEIYVNITSADKFVKLFDKNFLYRVGNQNKVKLGSLFTVVNGIDISDETVEVDVVGDKGDASGTYTPNDTWTNGTLKFSGTGVVKVTIRADGATPVDLYLEVVDATNLTSAKGTTTGGNFVLLCDINTSSYVYYWNSTLYGNGFTYSLKGAPTNYSSAHGHGVLLTQNATLDNLVILGDTYDEYGAYTNNNDYNAAIDVMGETIIQNCYIAGCSAPISTRANATIKNTTLYGGAVANLIIKGGTVTLENVTTANYDDGRYANNKPIGMGIVIHSDATEDAKLVLNGTLTQYNFIGESKVPSDTYAKNLHNAMFADSCNQYHFNNSTDTYVNTGIIALTTNFGIMNITDNANTGYVGQSVSASGFNGYVYTQPNTSGSVNNNCPEYKPTTQGAVPPSYSFDYTTKNYIAKTEGSNDYCYYDNGKVLIAMDEGDTVEWDPFILTATKNGATLDYTVSMNGKTYVSGEKIAFNTAGEYTVTYTYTDNSNYGVDEDGNITTYSELYTKTVDISVSVIKPTAKHAKFTFGSSNTTTEKITVSDKTYISAKGVSTTDKQWGYITVNGTKIFYPIINAEMKKNALGTEVQVYYYVFNGTVTITDYKAGGTGDEQVYNASTTTMPSNLSVVNGMEAKYTDINSACVDISKLTKDGPSGEVWDFSASTTVSGTTKYNGYLAHSSPSGLSIKAGTRDYDAITVAQFSYKDAAGATYYYFVGYFMPNQVSSSSGGSGCVTPDTLITLANGTQVRVDSLTGSEKLLVWNMETGLLDEAAILFVDNDPEVESEIVHLYFSDGTDVKVIYEHGFWDYDLNKYVYLDADAAQYIGHTFAKHSGNVLSKVKLTDVVIEKAVTTAWSPVTADHLCYFVNGMLSMPGGVGGLFNIFDVDPSTMAYDMEALARDIETYGLFTYEELNTIVELPAEMFNAAGGAYLKVSIGKGNLTMDELICMIERYTKFFK